MKLFVFHQLTADKISLYQPNIALISGIAWDHINVPTYENYM
jgi:UDP-N-acetylmuramate: L-alanyl-gamma-D-glutamyl-meso-diaminopimelate ligase